MVFQLCHQVKTMYDVWRRITMFLYTRWESGADPLVENTLMMVSLIIKRDLKVPCSGVDLRNETFNA